MLRAAAEVFAEHGYAQSSVQQVVERAGVSRQMFYREFDDLRDALMQVTDFARGFVFRAVEAAVRAVDDPIEKLETALRLHLSAIAYDPVFAKVVSREVLALGSEGVLRRDAIQSAYTGLIMEGLSAAHGHGIVSRPPDEMTAFMLVGGIDALTSRAIDRGDHARLPELVPQIMTVMLSAFGHQP